MSSFEVMKGLLVLLFSLRVLAAVNVTFDNAVKYKFDTDGNAIDTTSGTIDFFNGSYIWYGIAFGCGEGFCGIHSYSSPDLATWSYNGYLFDPSTDEIVKLCAASGNCGRPHILYDDVTKTYILWVNAGTPGYALLTSTSPTSDYVLSTKRAVVGIQSPTAMAGDFSVAVINGTGYLAYSLIDFTTVGASIWPPFLQSLYLQPLAVDLMNTTGVASHASDLVDFQAESPGIFYRHPYYYVSASNTCGFCTGTLLVIYRSPTPTGPWERQILSADTCGGQSNNVITLPSPSNPSDPTCNRYVHLADLVRTAPLAGSRMAAHGHGFQLLEFSSDGSLQDLNCSDAKSVTIPVVAGSSSADEGGLAVVASDGSGQDLPYKGDCLLPAYQLYQTFTASKTGSLVEVGINVAGDAPNSNLSVTIFRYDNDTNFYTPRYVWETLASVSIPPTNISAAFNVVTIPVGQDVKKGDKLGIALVATDLIINGVSTGGASVTPMCVLITGGGTPEKRPYGLGNWGAGVNSTAAGYGGGRTIFAIGANQVSFRGPEGKTPPIVVIPGEIKWFAAIE